MHALALDLATRLGWAIGHTTSSTPQSGSYSLPKTGEELGPFFAAYHNWLIDILNKNNIEIIVFEAPMPTQMGRSTIATTLKLQGLCVHTEFVGYMKKIKTFQVSASTWKKQLTGTGRVSKPKPGNGEYPVTTACRQRGWAPRCDNEADALGVWAYTCTCISPHESWHHMPLAAGTDRAHTA